MSPSSRVLNRVLFRMAARLRLIPIAYSHVVTFASPRNVCNLSYACRNVSCRMLRASSSSRTIRAMTRNRRGVSCRTSCSNTALSPDNNAATSIGSPGDRVVVSFTDSASWVKRLPLALPSVVANAENKGFREFYTVSRTRRYRLVYCVFRTLMNLTSPDQSRSFRPSAGSGLVCPAGGWARFIGNFRAANRRIITTRHIWRARQVRRRKPPRLR